MSKSDRSREDDNQVEIPVVGHYTDKSFVIRGDREVWGKKLVVIGARWMTRIRGAGPGWLINKERLPDLERIFGGKFKILSATEVKADQELPPKVDKKKNKKNKNDDETPEKDDRRRSKRDETPDKRRSKRDETPEKDDRRRSKRDEQTPEKRRSKRDEQTPEKDDRRRSKRDEKTPEKDDSDDEDDRRKSSREENSDDEDNERSKKETPKERKRN